MTSTLISLKNVSKSFAGRAVLKQINFDFEIKKLYWLRGENGSGKSTLLKVLAGILEPDFGKIEVRSNLNLAYQGHELSLYLHLTVIENLELFLKLSNRKVLIKELLQEWNLIKLSDARIAELSKGQAARVALALSFASSPDLLLLDEPAANLDDAAIAILTKQIGQLLAENKTVVIAAHDKKAFGRSEISEIKIAEKELKFCKNSEES